MYISKCRAFRRSLFQEEIKEITRPVLNPFLKGNALRILNPVLSSRDNLASNNDPSSTVEDETSTGLAEAAQEAGTTTKQVRHGFEKKSGLDAGSSIISTALQPLVQQLEDTRKMTCAVSSASVQETENKMADNDASGEVTSTGPITMEIESAPIKSNVPKLKPQDSAKPRKRKNTIREPEPSANQEASVALTITMSMAEESPKSVKDVHTGRREASKPGGKAIRYRGESNKITHHDTMLQLESVLKCKEMIAEPDSVRADKFTSTQPQLMIHTATPIPRFPSTAPTNAPPMSLPAESMNSEATSMNDTESVTVEGAVYITASGLAFPKIADSTEQLASANTTLTRKTPLNATQVEITGKRGKLPAGSNGRGASESLDKTSSNSSQRAEDTVIYDTLESRKLKAHEQSVSSTCDIHNTPVTAESKETPVYDTLEPPDSTLRGKSTKVTAIHNTITLESPPMANPKLGAAKSCDQLPSLHYAVSKPHKAFQITKGNSTGQGTTPGKVTESRRQRTLANSVSDTVLQGKYSSELVKTENRVKRTATVQKPQKQPDLAESGEDLEPIYTQPMKVHTQSVPPKNLEKLTPPSLEDAGLVQSSNSSEHVYNTLEPPPDHSTSKTAAQGKGTASKTSMCIAEILREQNSTNPEPVYAKPIPKLKRLGKTSTRTASDVEFSVSTEHVYNTLEPPPPPRAAADIDRKPAKELSEGTTECGHEYAILEPPVTATLI